MIQPATTIQARNRYRAPWWSRSKFPPMPARNPPFAPPLGIRSAPPLSTFQSCYAAIHARVNAYAAPSMGSYLLEAAIALVAGILLAAALWVSVALIVVTFQ